MHSGRFPAKYRAGKLTIKDQREQELLEELEELRDSAPMVGRRQWLVGAVCALVGGSWAVSRLWGDAAAGQQRDEKANDKPAAQPGVAAVRGSLPWAVAMLRAEDSELLRASGDIERVSARHRNESRLVPVFRRLLDVCLKSDDEFADMAGACAVRSLSRLGRSDLVLEERARIERRQDRVETQGAFESVLRRHERIMRRRRGR